MRRPRHQENFDPVIVSRDISRHASRNHFREPEPVVEAEPIFEPEPSFEPEPAPVAFQEPVSMPHAAEVISLEAMRSPAPNYQAEDLDVPAFLRKRSEVM